MNRIERALGRAMFLSLVELAGGERLPIPAGGEFYPSRHCRTRLVDRVGKATAAALELNFPGERLYIPKGPSPIHNATPRAISPSLVARLTRQKLTSRQIGAKLGCSQRAVHRKRAQARKMNLKLEQAK